MVLVITGVHCICTVVVDLDLSSGESGNGTMTPSKTPPYLPTDAQELFSPDLKSDFLPGTPLQDPTNILCRQNLSTPKQSKFSSQSKAQRAATSVSPMANWIPNWEEYGSYILSPQNISTQRYVQGLPGGRLPESQGMNGQPGESVGQEDSTETKADIDLLLGNDENSPVNFCSNDSDCSCDFEIIAEYSESDLGILAYDACI